MGMDHSTRTSWTIKTPRTLIGSCRFAHESFPPPLHQPKFLVFLSFHSCHRHSSKSFCFGRTHQRFFWWGVHLYFLASSRSVCTLNFLFISWEHPPWQLLAFHGCSSTGHWRISWKYHCGHSWYLGRRSRQQTILWSRSRWPLKTGIKIVVRFAPLISCPTDKALSSYD